MQIKLSGPESGVGAQLDYGSKVPIVGSGTGRSLPTTRARASPTPITNNAARRKTSAASFTFKPTGRNGRNVEITQNYDVDLWL